MKMSHEEYISKLRKRSADIAAGILDGSIHYLEGSIQLASLRFEVELPENDPDFLVFSGISSETDHLPIGSAREYWSEDALKRHEKEIEQAIVWAKEISEKECKSLIERFGG